jgi:hypothetical protein
MLSDFPLDYTIILLLLAVIFLCVYLEDVIFKHNNNNNNTNKTKEFFTNTNPYVKNAITDNLDETKETIENIYPFKSLDYQSILGDAENLLKIPHYEGKKLEQSKELEAIEEDIKLLSRQKLLSNTNTRDFHSIKSVHNSKPLNIMPLNNNKYLISVNGQCLESNSVARTKVQPCNATNPNQYFNLELVLNKADYDSHLITLGQFHRTDLEDPKYPLHLVKADSSGNCLINENGFLSVMPCKMDKTEQWIANSEPNKC